MIWTYPISHFLEKHWYDSFLHLYQRAPCKRFGSSSNSVLVKLIERLMDKGISAY